MAQQTAKEKAQELIEWNINFLNMGKFYEPTLRWSLLHAKKFHAKKFALIAVDETLKLLSNDLGLYYKDCIYWEEVKTEIEKL
jgi:hypothetical protein